MGKWTISFILLLHICMFRKSALVKGEKDFFSNIIFKESVDEAQCDQMQSEVAAMDMATIFDDFPKLHGKWVSQDCEVRPGPEFLLRNYFFTNNNSFRLLQHIYEDESCIFPLYTVVAKGKLVFKESSWITPSATECEYTLSTVTVIPHTTEMTVKLSKFIKYKCIYTPNKTWKPHREYTIYSSSNSKKFSENHRKRRKYGRSEKEKAHRDIDCLSAVRLEFKELTLIRTQTRFLEAGTKTRELLLGDIHSQYDVKFNYKPTAFQVPLLKSDQAKYCVNCHLISKGPERMPPHLSLKPQLPPLPHGQWVSQRCEVRPFGMFLKRKLSFDSRDCTWVGEYKFFADPFCMEPSFAIFASGRFTTGSIQSKEKLIWKRKTGTNFDFIIEDASVTLYDSILINIFNAETNCGVGPWNVGVFKELSSTSGCSMLGIVLPATEYELIKLEIDRKGTPLLFMGLPDTDKKKRSHKNRPTSYQAPLAQCSIFPQQKIVGNHLGQIFYARTAPRSSASRYSWKMYSILKFLIVFYLIQSE